MAIRVTNAKTKHGVYYAAGDVIESTPYNDSLRRLFKWEIVSDPTPSLAGLRKPELIQLAEARGLDVSGLTKTELIDLLTE